MRYLIDTHILIWWLDGSKRLKNPVRNILEDRRNQVLVSVISAVEISIKQRSGKLKSKVKISKMFEIADFEVIKVDLIHALELDKLPNFKNHKDPFDRILIAQSQVDNLTLITHDPKIWKYKIKLLKA